MITNLSLIKSFFCTARTIFDCFSCILLQLAHSIYIRTVRTSYSLVLVHPQLIHPWLVWPEIKQIVPLGHVDLPKWQNCLVSTTVSLRSCEQSKNIR